MPRFQDENLRHNLALYERFGALAREAGCTPAQLSLVWLLSRGDQVIPIPGTTSPLHLEENFAAATLTVSPELLGEIDVLLEPGAIAGARYPASTLAEIDTEEFQGP
jgi:aryl-alcohol dehydrogenase-like predicted oxidoreductase